MGPMDLDCTDADVLEWSYVEPDGLYTNGEFGEFAGDLRSMPRGVGGEL